MYTPTFEGHTYTMWFLSHVVLPCVEMVKWIIDHVNLENKMTINEHGKCITSSHPNNLEMYYMFCKGKSVYDSILGGRV
jgi:hypothetical protein